MWSESLRCSFVPWIFSITLANRLAECSRPLKLWGWAVLGKKPVAYVFEPRVAGEEGLQAHVPVLPAPQDAMTALREAHVAAPGLLQLRICCGARAHQHLQALHTEAPAPPARENTFVIAQFPCLHTLSHWRWQRAAWNLLGAPVALSNGLEGMVSGFGLH